MNSTNVGSTEAAAKGTTTAAKLTTWDYAAKNAERKIPVFPVHPGCKTPCADPQCGETCRKAKTPLVSRGFNSATTDPATIAEWRSKWPDAMFGIPTGEASKLSVVDLDTKNGQNGEQALRDYLAEQGETWPETMTVETPTGGKHLLLQDVPGSKSRAGVLPGVDTRGNGGYVVFAGSRLADGRAYRIVKSIAPAKPSPAIARLLKDGGKGLASKAQEASAAVVKASVPPREKSELDGRYAAKALKGEAAAVRVAPEGERNHRLNVAAVKVGHLVPHLLDRAEAEAELTAAAMEAGLAEEETAKTIASGLAKGMAEPEWPPANIVPATAAEDFGTPQAVAGFERFAASIGLTVDALKQEALAVAARAKAGGFDNSVLRAIEPKTLAELLAGGPPQPRSWLVKGLLMCGTLTVIGGAGGTGKSSVMNGIALSVAAGLPFMGFDVRNPNGEAVLILNHDDDEAEIARRMGALADHYKVPATALGRVHVLGSDMLGTAKACRVQGRGGELVFNGDWFDRLAEWIRRTGTKVVILDPLFGIADLDENSNEHMGAFGGYLNRFAKALGVSVVLVHHANKGGVAAAAASGGDRSANLIAGGRRLIDAARAAYVVDGLSEADAPHVGLDRTDDRLNALSGLWGVKGNYSGRGAARAYFRMEAICLNNARGLDASDMVAVAVPYAVPKAAATSAVLTVILRLIVAGAASGAYTRKKSGGRGGNSRFIVPAIIAGVDWTAEGLEGPPPERNLLDILQRRVLRAGLAEETLVPVQYKSKTEERLGLVLTPAGQAALARLEAAAAGTGEAENPFG
jgi:hypothetical protein